MSKKLKFLAMVLTCILLSINYVWADPTVLLHETFGNNAGSARNWNDTASHKSGVSAVYSGASYTITNAKQSKNNAGSVLSSLQTTSTGSPAVYQIGTFIVGPLSVANYTSLTVTYDWRAASTKGTYYAKLYYKTSSGGSFSEVTGTGTGKTTFVSRSHSLPVAAQVATLYLKVEWYTSNSNAQIDEFELKGTSSGGSTYTVDFFNH